MRRQIQRIHFVGIGGIGMSALAEVLHGRGFAVSGSDLAEGPALARLRSLGIEVSLGHAAEQLGAANLVVHSSAVPEANAERVEAVRRGLSVASRGELLAELMRPAEGIAVAGSHGKTTTTALIAHLLEDAGLAPTVVLGGRRLGPAAKAALAQTTLGSDLLVAEADESDGSFLKLAPVTAVITNIDPEHLDHYGSVEALDDAFATFANGVPFWGASIVCRDHSGVQRILPRINRRVIRYGLSPAADATDFVAADLRTDGLHTHFSVERGGRTLGKLRIPLLGPHNVANALAALAVALEHGVDFERAAGALASFGGVARRFESKGSAAGVAVVDDYAHHPAEIRATLAAARLAKPARVVAIFQPHRYTRTRDCLEDFGSAFADADLVVVSEVYAAGEDPIPGADGRAVADAIREGGHGAVQFSARQHDIVDSLPARLREGDLLLSLGAGDISAIGPQILEALAAGAREAPRTPTR